MWRRMEASTCRNRRHLQSTCQDIQISAKFAFQNCLLRWLPQFAIENLILWGSETKNPLQIESRFSCFKFAIRAKRFIAHFPVAPFETPLNIQTVRLFHWHFVHWHPIWILIPYFHVSHLHIIWRLPPDFLFSKSGSRRDILATKLFQNLSFDQLHFCSGSKIHTFTIQNSV